MTLEGILIACLIGGIAGWLAAVVMKGRGLGVPGNIAVGIIGAFVGDWVFNLLKISITTGFAGSIINAFIGALIVLFLIGLIKKA
ncbi:MAG: GlsB/YeaQ/YmgE family stress response membrane protein [Xanthomonadales bacterium]|nr:GlsB/YeaQ/YmgE family stress response membrane protein [Xanthomonadales bacterium]